MKKRLIYFTMTLLFSGLSLWACSGDTGGESEKGAIKQMTDRVAKDLVHQIRSPINKARAVKDREDDRLSNVVDVAEDSFQTE